MPSPARGRGERGGGSSSGGLAPTADARLVFEQFVQGDLTEEQLVNAILAR